jgi:endonuclease/exonuclease/phosphatase family metal-dependent hydrolase
MRQIKFITVNIYKGKYLGKLIDFINNEDPDIIAMQEVTSGSFNLCADKNLDLFEFLKSELNFNGAFERDLWIKDPRGEFGNAVFSKFKIYGAKTVVLKPPQAINLEELGDEASFPNTPRHLLDAIVEYEGRKIHAMSWHGAWTAPPTDTKETLRQAQIVADYLKSLNEPFILGCDANNIMENKTISLINNVAKNILIGTNIQQTTHPAIHKIVPRGYLVDFIFTSNHFKTVSVEVPKVTVSDHLPVVAVLEF